MPTMVTVSSLWPTEIAAAFGRQAGGLDGDLGPDGVLGSAEPQALGKLHSQDGLRLIALVEEAAGDEDFVGHVHQRRFPRHGQADGRGFLVAVADLDAFDVRIGIGRRHARQLFELCQRVVVQRRRFLAAAGALRA